ncbi:MAG: penicillin acylase family protein [Candidatus Alcyoniella australis]|nr:penicillin acylase family protein [Candidatus Alcyoniella australis]
MGSAEKGVQQAQPRRRKFVWRVAIGTCLLIVALFFGMRLYVARGYPQTSGTFELPGLLAEVEVLRDQWGVPHVYAQNEHDALFAQGVVHAQDRRFQMEGISRTVFGELSALAGPIALEQDKIFRSYDMRGIARRVVGEMPERLREGMQAYCDGVNAVLADDPTRLPLEFRMMDAQPAPWTPEDVVGVFLLNCWYLSLNFPEERLAADLSATLTQQEIELLFGFEEPGAIEPGAPPDQQELAALETLLRFSGPAASNNWAAGMGKTKSGEPILANDPHLGLTLPCIWYEVHIQCPQFRFAGFSIPGAPFVAIGRNAGVAWGFTNVMTDNADLVLEKVRLETGEVLTPDGWQALEQRSESFEVRGGETLVRKMYRGPNGPIVRMPKQENLDAEGMGIAYALRWVGQDERDSLAAFEAMVRSRNSAELIQAVRLFQGLSQNLVYVDLESHYGWQPFGSVPRRTGYSGKYPVPGWESDTKRWTGYVPFEMLPHERDPGRGYVLSANTDSDDGLDYTISHSFVRPYRYNRINELLDSGHQLDLEAMAKIQGDTQSLQAPVYLAVVFAEAGDDPQLSGMVELLEQWDRNLAPDSAAAAVYEVFLGKLWRLWIGDELGELFEPFARRKMPLDSPLDALVGDPSNQFWDDRNTEGVVETRREIVRAALMQTNDELSALLGPDMSKWSWGAIHGAIFQHPAGAGGLAGRLLDFGPLIVGGDAHTINANAWSIGSGWRVAHYPSLRFLFDAADPDHPRSAITTGQSGHPGNEHYSDQAPLWAEVSYKTQLWNREEIEQASKSRRLLLRPVEEAQ